MSAGSPDRGNLAPAARLGHPSLCRDDNWHGNPEEPQARAIRWATVTDRFSNKRWTKWHYTEGNGGFTACDEVIVIFAVDGSPEEGDVDKISCAKCLAKMRRAGVKPSS